MWWRWRKSPFKVHEYLHIIQCQSIVWFHWVCGLPFYQSLEFGITAITTLVILHQKWSYLDEGATLTQGSHAREHTLLSQLFCSKWDYHLQKITSYCIEKTMNSSGKWSLFEIRWVCSYWPLERSKITSVLASLLRPWSSAHISSIVNDLDKSSRPTNQPINQPTNQPHGYLTFPLTHG